VTGTAHGVFRCGAVVQKPDEIEGTLYDAPCEKTLSVPLYSDGWYTQ
jgi:hypothetical protein